jgi:predicted DNA-binding ribbon-helix-helix protein
MLRILFGNNCGAVSRASSMNRQVARPEAEAHAMKSSVVKRSIVVAGHKTSVSLEDAFWNALKEIAGRRDITISDLVAAIDSQRQHSNLSSAIRLFVLDFYRNQLPGGQEGEGTSVITIKRPVPLAPK